MKTRLSFKPISSGLMLSMLCITTAAYAQNTTNASNNPNNQTNSQTAKTGGGGSSADEFPDIVEIDPFGGIETSGQVMRGLDTKLVDGGVAGLRVGFNPSKYLGFEFFFDYAQANVEFKTPSNGGVYPASAGALAGAPIPTYSFGSRNYYYGLNPVINLRPRGSRFQPYLTVGVGGINFTPTDTARGLARSTFNQNAFYSGNLKSNLQVALNYGGGVKFHLTDHFGLRLDARGFWSRNPTYGLPNYPDGGIYIPSHDKLNSFQGTVGLVFYLGQSKCPEMPPAPPPPPALPTPTITGAEGTTICQGKPVTLHAQITPAAGRTVKYAWTLNGAAQTATGPDFTFTPNNVGTFNVQVTVTDVTPPPPPMERPKKFPVRCWVQPPAPQPPAPVTATTSVTVNDTPPTVTNVSANPNTLVASVDQGPHTAQLTATAQGGPCSTNLTYKWTVSEGSLTNDTTATATFDASTLNFEGGQNQTKTVTATVTVTDENGRTATGNTTITVNYTPPFVRLDDVVFAKNSARVNNCGKRILIDDTAPRLSSGDYDIVLVGHRANGERENAAPAPRTRRRGRRTPPVPLDEQRVLNAAAVLSGGTGTCGHVDPARIKVDWVGTTQTSDPRPGLCGTSNVKERKGSVTTEADRDQRVEVYLVPHGSTTMPPAVQNAKPLPEDQVKALGCPK